MMSTKVCIFLLAVSVAAFAQHGSGGHTMGGPPSDMGAGGSAMGGSSMGGSHGMSGSRDTMGSSNRPSDTGKQTPDAILTRDSQLNSNLQKLLPKGMTPQQACSGFKNLGQCVAAIHVSHNLGISFNDLKDKMTGSNSERLGKAIHELKPDVNAKAEAKKGEKQASQDLSRS